MLRASLDFRVADTSVRVEAPEGILSVLDSTLSFVPRCAPSCDVDVLVSVQPKADVWEIRGLGGSFKVLGAQSALPQVAGAVVSSVVSDVAINRNVKTMRASVLEKDGRALAMVGDDWESAMTMSAHLHGRGWSYVGTDNVLLDPDTLDVNSSSVAQFPMEYRRAVEASPWYVTPQGISFYAVDPRFAGHDQTWASATKLHGVIVVDGSMNDRPSLESLDERTIKSERFSRYGIDWERVRLVNLCIGGFVDTSDLVEHWFESIRV
jgi:hypothetical protein